MIALLLIYLYIALATIPLGRFLVKSLEKFKIIQTSDKSYHIDILCILGFICITTFFGFYSLFFRLGGIYPHLIIVCASLISIFKCRQEIKRLFKTKMLFESYDLIFLLLIFLFVIFIFPFLLAEPTLVDTGLYHAQTIQWFEKFPVLPGLGNLHGRFAFNSHFFISSALFSFDFLGKQTVFPINGFFVLLLSFRIIYELRKNVAEKNITNFFISFILIFFLFSGQIPLSYSSPGTDFMPVVFLYYLFILFLDNKKEEQQKYDYKFLSIILITSTVITIKLSALPVILLLLPFFLSKIFWSEKRWILVLGCCFVVFIPWLIRYVILSGYLIYPFPGIDIFNFDWKIPIKNVIEERDWVIAWARKPGPKFMDSLSMPVTEWLPTWFFARQLSDKILFIGCLVSPLLSIGLFFIKKQFRNYLIFSFISTIGFLFWFWNGPDIRFGFGYLFFCNAIPLALILQMIYTKKSLRYKNLIFALLLLGLNTYGIKKVYINESFGKIYSHFYYPSPMTNNNQQYIIKQATNFTLYYPNNDQRCYNICIPCTPYFKQSLEMRGETFRSGFRLKQGK